MSMYVVLLRFSENRNQADRFVEDHEAWLQRGFADGVFLAAGRIPDQGGGILAHGPSRADLEERVGQDPFVAEKVVSAEIVEIAASMTDERLAFLRAA